MRITQTDIAKLAKVSQATVSRVLAGDARVEPDIRDRVVAVVHEHNYKPDVRARSLRQRRTNLIGVVLKREPGSLSTDPFFAALLAEIVDCLAGSPYHLCVDIATDQKEQKHVYDELLRTKRVDGLILVESEPSDRRVQQLQRDEFPFVLIGNAGETDGLTWIDNDNFLAGEIAAKHLVDQGYRQIAMVAGPEELTVTAARVKGYLSVLKSAGLTPNVLYADFGMESAKEAASRLLGRQDRPDAILAMDDTMAMGAVQAARSLGLSIPEDVGVVGFNNSALCELIEGGLTSIDLQIGKMVRWAVQSLLDLVEDGVGAAGGRTQTLGCKLVVRGSTARRSR